MVQLESMGIGSAGGSILFDTSDPAQCEMLHRLRALLQERSDIEALNQDLFVLHILPDATREVLP